MTARRRSARPPVDYRDCWPEAEPTNFDQLPEAHTARQLLARIASGPAQRAEPEALDEARSVLQPFASRGKSKRTPRTIDINDRIAVAGLEMAAEMAQPPLTTPYTGAWLARMKERGAGHCAPLPGAAEGLHLLVLDRQGMAELSEAIADFQLHVDRYEQLMVDAAELRRLQRRKDDTGEAG